MATVTLNGPSYYLAGTNVDSLNSPVVGYESTYNRVARYSFISPTSGATQVSLSFTGMTFADGTQKPLRFYIGTSDSDHANAGSGSSYTGEMSYSGSTWSGSASILLQPATTYYLWIFPSTTTYGYWYWNTGSASMSTNGGLKTTISAGNGTLNSSHTITLTRYSTDFKHTITATCGTSTITVATGVQAASYTWTPPIDWCYQQASSIYVDVTIYCETFSGSESCGKSQTTVTMTMPESVKPSVTLSVGDANGYKSTFGNYVQSKSQANVTTTSSGIYGSSISTTVITVGSLSRSMASGTFDLPSSGTITVKATVTDTRGRTATASTTITVLAYSAPSVQITSLYRCDSAGTETDDGSYVKVTWSASITSLNSKNSAAYTLEYKVRGTSTWTSVTLSDQAGNYSVSGATKIISASADNAFDFRVTAKDYFATVNSSNLSVSATGPLIRLYRATGDLQVFARTTFYGATNMTKMVLLWSNASPTSTFASQSISSNFVDYNMYIVIARHSTSIAGAVTVINKVGSSSRLITVGASSSYSETIRTVSSTQTGLTFGNANKNGSTANDFLIPIYIYGIKGVG